MKLGFFSDEVPDEVVMMEMRRQDKQLYEFGPFRLDASERLLTREGETVQLPPRVFDTLLALVEHEGRLLEKDELIKILWPDSFVEEGSLTRNVSYLRKALGDGEAGQQFIETVPRRGYRFVAPVKMAFGNGREAEHRTEINAVVTSAPIGDKSAKSENGHRQSLAPEPLASPAATASGVTGNAVKRKRWLPAALALAIAAVAVIAVYVVRASRSAADVFL
ncbi:MAG TPA: transcriptional regulator, partial [Blastocatellia bacterium]|nr:transcriptional regulator [Blastocatellia bacterium]